MLLYALLCYALLCVPNVPKSRFIALNCCNNGLICDNYRIFAHSPGNAGAEKTREAEQNGDTSKAETSSKILAPFVCTKTKNTLHLPSSEKIFQKTTCNSNSKKTDDMKDVKDILGEAQEKMDMAVMYLEDALAHIRAGKADVRLLDGIRVDSYGSMVPINNVAAVTTPDARSIAIKPWDKSMFRVIEKAIIDSALGIMPENNGEIIRIGIPPLTEERRKQLAKQCKGEGETAKVSVRNARRDAIDQLKKAVKEGLAEDAQKGGEEKLQKVHDKYIKQIDDMLAAKDKEIMTV